MSKQKQGVDSKPEFPLSVQGEFGKGMPSVTTFVTLPIIFSPLSLSVDLQPVRDPYGGHQHTPPLSAHSPLHGHGKAQAHGLLILKWFVLQMMWKGGISHFSPSLALSTFIFFSGLRLGCHGGGQKQIKNGQKRVLGKRQY